ncbi:hypothetical protein [Achromobacter xylosoxidans]|uniref:hypothetical protein n=2 Tax=Bacteria TaxID=2 RepID=UPI0015677953|nr:hypothetical protein [Achromobacter xylosoxidans]MBK1978206.1 hypothetical protein [Achromobacter xylosoxidans]MCZ8385418.1 hypothetical protein [Achromobacter xylosoxidans]QKI71493.1 hypothetical protein HPS44_18540 [Achromobacter xylosoxidans]
MQVSNSTLSGPSGPLGFNYSSTRFTTDANGEARFTEVMGSAKQKYIESPPASKAVTLSDKAVALSNKESEDKDADLSLLTAWTPEELARFANNYTEEERYQRLETWAFFGDGAACDCSDAIYGGPDYYATTRIPITPESKMIDKRQADACNAELKAMYAAEKAKGSSAMDIYKKMGHVILSQPNDFAYRFGLSVKYREAVESMDPWGGHGNPFVNGVTSISYDPPDESNTGMPAQVKDELSHSALQRKVHAMERDRQYLLMDLLYGKVGHTSTGASNRSV